MGVFAPGKVSHAASGTPQGRRQQPAIDCGAGSPLVRRDSGSASAGAITRLTWPIWFLGSQRLRSWPEIERSWLLTESLKDVFTGPRPGADNWLLSQLIMADALGRLGKTPIQHAPRAFLFSF
jgi:hypothetical protein